MKKIRLTQNSPKKIYSRRSLRESPTPSLPLSPLPSPPPLPLSNHHHHQLQSQAIHAAGLIFVSGQIPARADGTLVTGSIAEQTTACIEGLVNILEAAGSELAKVTKVTVFITDMANFGEMVSDFSFFCSFFFSSFFLLFC